MNSNRVKLFPLLILAVGLGIFMLIGLAALFWYMRQQGPADVVDSKHVTIRTSNVETLHLKEGKLYLTENGVEKFIDLTDRYIVELNISPAKGKFAFIAASGTQPTDLGTYLYEYTLAGGKLELYAQAEGTAADSLSHILYSPDGKYIAFSRGKAIGVLDTVNEMLQMLDNYNNLVATVWHSNGQFMSVSTADSNVYKVFALNAEGTFDNVFY